MESKEYQEAREAIAKAYCLKTYNCSLEHLRYDKNKDITWQHPYIIQSFQFADSILNLKWEDGSPMIIVLKKGDIYWSKEQLSAPDLASKYYEE